jgi:hypothetical protein
MLAVQVGYPDTTVLFQLSNRTHTQGVAGNIINPHG